VTWGWFDCDECCAGTGTVIVLCCGAPNNFPAYSSVYTVVVTFDGTATLRICTAGDPPPPCCTADCIDWERSYTLDIDLDPLTCTWGSVELDPCSTTGTGTGNPVAARLTIFINHIRLTLQGGTGAGTQIFGHYRIACSDFNPLGTTVLPETGPTVDATGKVICGTAVGNFGGGLNVMPPFVTLIAS